MPAFKLTCLAAVGLALAGYARAQPLPGPPVPPLAVTAAPQAQAPAAAGFQAAPVPHPADAPVHVYAPVSPPYSGTAYRDLGGQPETSADAIAAQGAHPR